MLDEEFTTGRHDGYQWLSHPTKYIHNFLQDVPEALVGKYVAITSVDSGVVRLEQEDIQAGWSTRGNVVYTPAVTDPMQLPHQRDGYDTPGFDEYYVFTEPRDIGVVRKEDVFSASLGTIIAFVNLYSFNLVASDDATTYLIDLFWSQMQQVQPETYVADSNNAFLYATNNPDLFAKAVHALRDAHH